TFRRSVLGVPAAGAAALAAMGVQAWYAGHRALPRFGDLDPSGTFGAVGAPEVRIALIGDSTVTGPGLDGPDDLWMRQVARRLARDYRVSVRSHAVGGARARDVLMYQVRAAMQDAPDVAIVSVGANDALRRIRIRRFEAELTAIVNALRDAGATVVLAGVGDVGTAPRLPFPLKVIVSERSRAADRVHTRVAARLEGVVKVPIAELSNDLFRRSPELFCADLFHPNRAGHEVWVDAAYPVLEEVVAQVSRASTTRSTNATI
ncbi:MAG: SGNH/GDSL hydrolase family protein, partial [Actinomycetota bacterium]